MGEKYKQFFGWKICVIPAGTPPDERQNIKMDLKEMYDIM
jgi:hypothetical protein